MDTRLDEFNAYREKMNERIVELDHLGFIPCHPKLGQGELTKLRGFAKKQGFASQTIK